MPKQNLLLLDSGGHVKTGLGVGGAGRIDRRCGQMRRREWPRADGMRCGWHELWMSRPKKNRERHAGVPCRMHW